MTTLNYLINILNLPEDLDYASKDCTSELFETAKIYKMLCESPLLWKVWHIDEYSQIWVEINIVNEYGEPVFHTLKLDEGTYDKVECDNYQIYDL